LRRANGGAVPARAAPHRRAAARFVRPVSVGRRWGRAAFGDRRPGSRHSESGSADLLSEEDRGVVDDALPARADMLLFLDQMRLQLRHMPAIAAMPLMVAGIPALGPAQRLALEVAEPPPHRGAPLSLVGGPR